MYLLLEDNQLDNAAIKSLVQGQWPMLSSLRLACYRFDALGVRALTARQCYLRDSSLDVSTAIAETWRILSLDAAHLSAFTAKAATVPVLDWSNGLHLYKLSVGLNWSALNFMPHHHCAGKMGVLQSIDSPRKTNIEKWLNFGVKDFSQLALAFVQGLASSLDTGSVCICYFNASAQCKAMKCI